jgi:histone deacetylase complex regulatory component SIN3
MANRVESALEFLCKIKEVYGADSPRYQDFIDVMKDFKAGR